MLLGVIPSSQGASAEQNMSMFGIPAAASENWAAGMPDMFCSADAPWLDGITPRSISSHDGIRPVFFSYLL